MDELLGHAAFRVAGTEYVWGDVVAAARHWGTWDELEAEVREGLACLQVEPDLGAPLTPRDAKTAATAFRYERRLISAEDMQAWLATWHVTQEEWLDHLRRSILRQRHAAQLRSINRSAVDDDEVARRTWPTAVCSGRLVTFARELAARAACACAVEAELEGTALQGRLDRFEPAFARFRDEAADEPAIRRAMASHHLDWIRVESRWLRYATEGAALEARWCVEADGMALEEVAALSGSTAEARCFLLEEAEASLRDVLLAAAEGELLRPLPVDGGFALVQVTAKLMPSTEDSEILERARDAAIEEAIGREIALRVVWHEPL